MFKRYFKKLKNNLVAEPIGSAPRSCKNVPWQPRLSRRKHSFSYYPIGFFKQHCSASLKESNDKWVLLVGFFFLRACSWEVEWEAPREPIFRLIKSSLSISQLYRVRGGIRRREAVRPLGRMAKGKGRKSTYLDAVAATKAEVMRKHCFNLLLWRTDYERDRGSSWYYRITSFWNPLQSGLKTALKFESHHRLRNVVFPNPTLKKNKVVIDVIGFL